MSDRATPLNISKRQMLMGSATAGLATMATPFTASSLSLKPAGRLPRQRLSLNADWRFILGDPAGASGLLYDVRPEIKKSEDGKAADARPEDAQKVDAAAQAILKPWILPTANPFIKEASKHHARPAGNPPSKAAYIQADFDDSTWRQVNLPHDWAIEGPFLKDGPYGGMGRLKSWGPSWYRKTLDISAKDKGKTLLLDIDGAMSYATVWLNDKLVGGWPYGYASWRADLTPYVNYAGKNQLVIRLDSPPESSRWYPGAGLYRSVWLTKTNPVQVGQWGTFIRTPDVSKTSATVELDVTVDNQGDKQAAVEVTTRLYKADADGKPTGKAVASFPPAKLSLAAKSSATVKGATKVTNPQLWGPPPQQKPNRYCAVTELHSDGKLVDRFETPFGIRSVRFDADKGVFVNDERIALQGVNNHHDLGALGAAFNVRAAERQLEILHEMGCNALRMSHNPPAPELLDLADKMGFLVIDEIFDNWYQRKTPLDFHLIFPDWHEPDLRAILRRDRNHPSVIIWSVGNEVGEQYGGADGAKVAEKLVAIAREEDSTRPNMTAMNYAKSDMPLPAVVDLLSLNYQGSGIRAAPSQFPAFRAKFPNKVIFHSESAAAISSRGEYQFPVPGGNSAPSRPGVGQDNKTQQVSAYELFTADFGASVDRNWAAHDQNPFVAGEFVWSGWDYLGEPTPFYSARSSYFGIIDLAGFKKDRFYLYQSRWRADLPMAHILPHWTWANRTGEITPVHVFTSGDEAELFINGKSQGRKKKNAFEYRLRWDYTVYEPGEVSVITYKGGKEWARASVKTVGAAVKLEAEADRHEIRADGDDLSFITVRITDASGIIVPQANHRVRFKIEGPGEIVATDNGDPTNFEAFPSKERAAFNGLCLAIVKAKPDQRGEIRVTAEAETLQSIAIKIRAV